MGFKDISNKVDFVALERDMLAFWRESGAFEQGHEAGGTECGCEVARRQGRGRRSRRLVRWRSRAQRTRLLEPAVATTAAGAAEATQTGTHPAEATGFLRGKTVPCARRGAQFERRHHGTSGVSAR